MLGWVSTHADLAKYGTYTVSALGSNKPHAACEAAGWCEAFGAPSNLCESPLIRARGGLSSRASLPKYRAPKIQASTEVSKKGQPLENFLSKRRSPVRKLTLLGEL